MGETCVPALDLAAAAVVAVVVGVDAGGVAVAASMPDGPWQLKCSEECDKEDAHSSLLELKCWQ